MNKYELKYNINQELKFQAQCAASIGECISKGDLNVVSKLKYEIKKSKERVFQLENSIVNLN